MEKILLNSDLDLINAINKFGVEWEKEIKNEKKNKKYNNLI